MTTLLLACGPMVAGEWSRFRGPNGSGIAADKEVPVKWAGDNFLWKTAVPGIGHSSPIVKDGRLFLQSSAEDGKARWLIALDAATGEILWKTAAQGQKAQRKHPRNSLASSTPATDGQRVYAVSWDGVDIHLGAYDFKDGKPVWEKDLGGFNSQHGVGHSPMLVDGKVIVANDQDGSAVLLAFDARTGAKAWEAERKPFRSCYSTPVVHVKPDGGKELIVASTAGITAYNPADGKENWWYTWSFTGMPLRTVASPVVADGLVFANSGDGSGLRHTIAVRLGGKGDVTATHLAWEDRKKLGFPYVPCLLAQGDYLFCVHDDKNGTVSCHKANTGEEVWKKDRLSPVGFTASPVLAGGRVYAPDDNGTVYVFEAGPSFKLLAQNRLGERVFSTPAVADNRLYMRGDKHLFCIGKPPAAGRGPGESLFNVSAHAPAAVREDKKVDTRVFELRIYTAAPGKLDALNARFRNHTNRLFEKHGMTIIGFWMPAKQKEGEEKLIYILAYPSKEAADRSWKAFRDDPDWKKAREESEKNGSLLAKPPESVYMNPTDYSPLK
jgi:outer membrane protein assembly factor BamB